MTERRVTKVELLDMARATVADRGAHYGAPSENFERIAARWRAHIKNAFGVDVPLTAINVAVMHADVKLARLEHEPEHLDSWVDVAGYAACGADIATEPKPVTLKVITDAAVRLHEANEQKREASTSALEKFLQRDAPYRTVNYATGPIVERAPRDFG